MPHSEVVTRLSFPLKTYNDAARALGNSCGPIPICGNTFLVRETNGTETTSFALIFHHTKIVRYFPDGRIQLNSGGYRTATTKHRMNQFSRVRVAQVKGEWMVYAPSDYATTGQAFEWDLPVPFVDGDTLNPDYKVGV